MIEEHGGALYRDFLFYYGVDLIEVLAEIRRPGGAAERKPLPPPSFYLSLFQGLPPGSMTEASAHDSPENTGWTVEAHLLASTSDWAQVGAIAGGNWKKKAPDFNAVERPFSKKKKAAKKKQSNASVASIYSFLEQKQHQVQGG